MNDTGGGVTAIHEVPWEVTRIGFHWMLFVPVCHSNGGLLFCLHTECLGDHVFSLSRICEFAIFFFFTHGMSRSVTDFFVQRLVLGPTDQREVIAEFLSITRIVADGCGACSSCEWGAIRRCL